MSEFSGETISPMLDSYWNAGWASNSSRRQSRFLEWEGETETAKCLDCSIDCCDWSESSLSSGLSQMSIDQRFDWQRRSHFHDIKSFEAFASSNINWSITFSIHTDTSSPTGCCETSNVSITNTAARSFLVEAKKASEKLISPSSVGTKAEIHFSLFQIIALFGCLNGHFTREARGDFFIKT